MTNGYVIDVSGYKRLTIDDLDNDGFLNLINKIIKDEVDFYKESIKKKLWSSQRSFERFFMSEYFRALTNIDGNYIIRKTREIAEQELEEERKEQEKKQKGAKFMKTGLV